MKFRARCFLIHLTISALVVVSAAGFVYGVWYRPPLGRLEGVLDILLLMAAVDVCAGPLCTLIAASPAKPRREFARDMTLIGLVQLAALGYALYAVGVARPAFLVYNIGIFEIERANELFPDQLARASSPAFASAPLLGPVYVEGRLPADPTAAAQIVKSAISGGPDIKDMPRYYIAWPAAGSDARAKGQPLSSLSDHGPLRAEVADLARTRDVPEDDVVTFPIQGKVKRGTVVLRKSDLSVLGILPESNLAITIKPASG